MEKGYLSEYFIGISVKILSAVEADKAKSNQHEYNGVASLKSIFGTERRTFNSNFIYMNDDDDEPVTDTGSLTWYDARENHPTRSEFRMYFTTTQVSMCASEGDMLFIGLRPDYTVLVIVAENGSTICGQLKWFFGIDTPHDDVNCGFTTRKDLYTEHDRLTFTSRLILEQLGICVGYSEDIYLDEMIKRFGSNFPSTSEFSSYARETLPDIKALDNPDMVLMSWLEREELLFRTFEKYIVSVRLDEGFKDDVEGFFKFSLSAHNRRKSRAGHALENHVEQLFITRKIMYERNKITENRSRPDFIFPSIEAYHNPVFDSQKLTMLGVKSTCKDRWRQIISEADKIEEKHLLTLEAAISPNQISEMRSRKVQLVVPLRIHETYLDTQREFLMSVEELIEMLSFRQRAMCYQNGHKI